tara:strand:+ start:641 stop:1483 length:843 start_codon:yes stop_codon:yes gene_type:complete
VKSYDNLIKDHYDKVAISEKDSPSSTMADSIIRETETKFIEDQVEKYTAEQNAEYSINGGYANGPGKNGDYSILDVGCGNGHTLYRLNKRFPEIKMRGLEFNDSLRTIAKERLESLNVIVEKGDIREFDSSKSMSSDIVISQRVLINLLDEGDQKKALNNLIDITSPGGLLIFIESFKDGLEKVNEARHEFGLSELPPAHHNLYLNQDFFHHPSIKIYDNDSEFLLSKHYFVSRVLHEFFLQKTGLDFKRNSNFVKFFSGSLQPAGDYSPIRLYAFRKSL